MAYRTEIHFIKKAHYLFTYCDEVCFKSKNLYNHANYLIRQQLFYLEPFLPHDGKEHGLYFQVKNHEMYKALPAQSAEGTLRKLEDNWQSFFEAIKKWKIIVNGSHEIMVKAFPDAMQLAGGDTRCALQPVRINLT